MIILGLDPGTAIVGWGVIDTGAAHDISRAVCLGYGCVTTDKTMTDSQRLLAIASGVEALIAQYRPEMVSVEKLFFFKNQKTVMTVSQARGVILLVAERGGLMLAEFTPLQVKQALTGYGKAEKQQIQQMTKLLLKLPAIPKPDDAADALAVAITAGQTRR
ncbi:crossover junction endodeoxyribonuclease RuvC [Patescibacteria group bacterium]|nr:crossover junction endodeoxyribonuclease RuvC [Patescibacteria group bacterium]